MHALRINGEPAGELDLNAGLGRRPRVPVVMLSGDDVTVAQAKQRLPGIETAIGQARAGAQRRPSPGAGTRLRADPVAARRGVERLGVMLPLRYEPPVTIAVTWMHAAMADLAAGVPGVTRLDAINCEYASDDFVQAFRAFMAMVQAGRRRRLTMTHADADRWLELRAQFPVLARHAYLNTGWSGPLSRGVVNAMRRRLVLEAETGPTSREAMDDRRSQAERLRAAMASCWARTARDRDRQQHRPRPQHSCSAGSACGRASAWSRARSST